MFLTEHSITSTTTQAAVAEHTEGLSICKKESFFFLCKHFSGMFFQMQGLFSFLSGRQPLLAYSIQLYVTVQTPHKFSLFTSKSATDGASSVSKAAGQFSAGKLMGKNCMEAIFTRFPGFRLPAPLPQATTSCKQLALPIRPHASPFSSAQDRVLQKLAKSAIVS